MAVIVLARESRLLARRRREHARRLDTVERAHLETHRRAVLADARQRLASTGREPALPLICRAQGVEDCYLWQLFGSALDGRFIEAGAADGVRNSVSWLFEAAGWTGVLVEADPDTAAQCAHNRPNSHVASAALGPPDQAIPGATVTFTRVLGQTDADHLSYAPDLARTRSVYARKAKQTEQIKVPLRTMNDVLAEAHAAAPHGAGDTYDFAVIDVEGAELALLQGFDLARFRTAVLMIEDLTGGTDPDVQRFMETAGYGRAARIERNTIYIRRDREDLITRAAELGWWPSEDRPGR